MGEIYYNSEFYASVSQPTGERLNKQIFIIHAFLRFTHTDTLSLNIVEAIEI